MPQMLENYEGMGTTLVAATVYDNILRVANVGDSRLYILGNEITQITRDHSLVEEMVRLGEVRKEDAKDHPDKNIITRAVGVLPEVTADFFEISLKPGDEILMCSDGLTNMIEDDEIRHIVYIADRYDILGKVGAGGMSDVYKAKDLTLGRFVAIKVLKAEFSEDINFVTKFRSEAQAAAGLEHPNIVNIYDVGSENGLHYIVM